LIRSLLLLALVCCASRLSAQQPAGITLTGVVVDAATGTPVPSALVSTTAQGPRALTDSIGRFRITQVPAGTRQLLVERFGYASLTVPLGADAGTAPLVLRLAPNPIALDSLTLTGTAQVDLSGLVFDAASGAPLPFASIRLSRDVVRDVARGASDAQGVSRVDDVTTGEYFFRVDRLGYVSQYVPTRVSAPPERIELRLQPDSAAQAGLVVMEQRIRTRSLGTGFSVQTFGESLLLRSQARGMRRFLEDDASLNLTVCDGARIRNDCLSRGGRNVSTVVYIDELRAEGLDQLDTYMPHEFFKIEAIHCRGITVIAAYTFQYMERVVRRARALLPVCAL
jgi:hypothetical protein